MFAMMFAGVLPGVLGRADGLRLAGRCRLEGRALGQDRGPGDKGDYQRQKESFHWMLVVKY
jgi:hypothetical protein